MAEQKLTGDALEAALTERGLSNDGTADERRQRVADYDAAKAAEAEAAGQGGSGTEDVASTSSDEGTQVVTADPRADQFPPSDTPGEHGYKGEPDAFSVQTDQGPGTANPQVATEATARPIASTVDRASSGPLEPPRDAVLQTDPPQGYSAGTTDQVYGSVGGRTIAGESFEGLVDENGNKVSYDSMFNDDDPGKTFVTVEQRVFEVFYYPNTTEKCTRLLYTPGQRVNRADAARIKSAIEANESGATL